MANKISTAGRKAQNPPDGEADSRTAPSDADMRVSGKSRLFLTAAVLISGASTAALPADPGFPKGTGINREFPPGKSMRHTPDPGATSGFLPTRITPRDGGQLALFRKVAERFRSDSTRHWEVRDGEVRISHDLIQGLTGGLLPASGPGRRLAAILAEIHGLDFSNSGIGFGAYLPNDKWLVESPQWGLRNPGITLGDRPGKPGVDIGITKVWDKFGGSDTLVIAVVDAGFDFRHPDLTGRNWVNKAEAAGLPGVDDDENGYVDDSLGWDFVDRDNLPQDVHGHGTFVSSVIAARYDNGEGIAGVLAEGKIMPIRVLDATGHGEQSDIARGVRYAVENGAHAINFSIGGNTDNAALRSAFQAARDRGIPIIVAAGNDGLDLDVTPAYPGAYNYENMLVVAAHDHAGLLSAFSNYGRNSVHLAAPGEMVLVCGLPPPIVAWKEDFEAASPDAWTLSTEGFALSTQDPLEGKQSLVWKPGSNNDSAVTRGHIDLRGIKGGALLLQLEFRQANPFDVVIVEGNKKDSPLWREIAVIGPGVGTVLSMAFGLHDFDGSEFKLRIRTSLPSRFSPSDRVLKIDDVSVTIPETDPYAEPVYTVVDGTSAAAPHVAAYVGLQRLASDRKAIPWSRSLALSGTLAEPALAGKVSTGGRLDAHKGLAFYLSTLPELQVRDSTVTTWKSGEKIEYSLGLTPRPGEKYLFRETGLPEGAALDGAGRLVWSPGPDQTGDYTVRLLAVGPTTLRRRLDFTVEPRTPVVAVAPADGFGTVVPGIWRIGGRAFRLHPGMASGRHRVEIRGRDATGKSRLFKKAWMDASEFRDPGGWGGTEPHISDAEIVHLQVRVDGADLIPIP